MTFKRASFLFWCGMSSFIISLGKPFVLPKRRQRRVMFHYTDEHVLCKMQNSICCIQQAHEGLSCCSKILVFCIKTLRFFKCRQVMDGNLLEFIYCFFSVCLNKLQFETSIFCKRVCVLNGKKSS